VLDTGIYQRILGLDVADLLLRDAVDVVNKGSIAELFVGLELLKTSDCYQKTSLYYWHRDAQHVAIYGREKRRMRYSSIAIKHWKSTKYICISAVRSGAAVWCVKSKIRL
jgi:hypothetical protein